MCCCHPYNANLAACDDDDCFLQETAAKLRFGLPCQKNPINVNLSQLAPETGAIKRPANGRAIKYTSISFYVLCELAPLAP